MTVAELIAILSKHPVDMPVMVDGYEYGFSDPIIKTAPIQRDIGSILSVGGPHEYNPDSPETLVISRFKEG